MGEDDLVFPGLADHDAVDALVAGWAAHSEVVVAAVRAWAQPGDEAGGDERARVYGVVVTDEAEVKSARQACVELVGRATGGPVAVEVAALSEGLPTHLRRLLDTGVVLWERPDELGSHHVAATWEDIVRGMTIRRVSVRQLFHRREAGAT